MATFKLPEIPVSINTPEARSDYLIRHYWDNFDFNDSLSISKPETAELFFVDFVDCIKPSIYAFCQRRNYYFYSTDVTEPWYPDFYWFIG